MIIAILALLGLVFGSFVNAFVWRLHEQETLRDKKKKPTKKQLDKFSILKGRSMCPDCKHELASKDLVPLFSWLALRGKCRYCAKSISWQYPLVEAATAVLFAISYAFWPLRFDNALQLLIFAVWLVFVVMFMALAVYDLRWFLLPNRVVYPLIILAIAEIGLAAIEAGSLHVLFDGFLGALVLSGLFWILFYIPEFIPRLPELMGGGDVKLAIVLGLLAGTPLKASLILFFSSVIGTICTIPILLKGKKGLKVQVPFGPFLLAATVVVVLFGTPLIDWYTRQLLG